MEVWRPYRNNTRTQGIIEYTNHPTYPVSKEKSSKLKPKTAKGAQKGENKKKFKKEVDV